MDRFIIKNGRITDSMMREIKKAINSKCEFTIEYSKRVNGEWDRQKYEYPVITRTHYYHFNGESLNTFTSDDNWFEESDSVKKSLKEIQAEIDKLHNSPMADALKDAIDNLRTFITTEDLDEFNKAADNLSIAWGRIDVDKITEIEAYRFDKVKELIKAIEQNSKELHIYDTYIARVVNSKMNSIKFCIEDLQAEVDAFVEEFNMEQEIINDIIDMLIYED